MDGSYSDAPVTPPDAKPAAPDESKSVDEQNAGEADVLIDKKKLPPEAKAGDTCTFKVVKDYGTEMSLQLVKDSEEEKGEPTGNNFDETTDNELTALDQKGA